MMFLLDVNALLAMGYTSHVHHARVAMWTSQLEAERGSDDLVFATCPITELGFVRVGSGKAAYAPSVDTARTNLKTLKSAKNMLFIPDDLHAQDMPAWVRKSVQTTDGYLLALAKSHGGHLVTLDRFIPDAMLIPDETAGPLMVRDEPVHSEWAHLMHRAPDQTGSQGLTLR
jgi:predicted nucleic acid-binding protein